jgi:hypothetical protein
MNHIPDTGEMVSDTPRTDAVYDVELLNRGIKENGRSWGWGTVSDFRELAKTLERELQETHGRIRLLIAERDSARQQADLNWKLREEFTALLGTDDVEEAVRELKRWKAKQISTTQTK